MFRFNSHKPNKGQRKTPQRNCLATTCIYYTLYCEALSSSMKMHSFIFTKASFVPLFSAFEWNCANQDQICRHLDDDICCSVALGSLSVSCWWRIILPVANTQFHYLPSTHICCPHNQHRLPPATQLQTRVIALLVSCVGVEIPCSGRLYQIVKNDWSAGNRFPLGQK